MNVVLPSVAMVSAPAAAGAGDRMEDLLRALDAKLQNSVLSQDTEALAEMLTEDWILISSSGRVTTRSAFLSMVGDPQFRLEVNASSEISIRVHGSTAIVTALLHERGLARGEAYENWLRYTDTWVLEAGAWRCVSAHASSSEPPAGAARCTAGREEND
jgi:ketosteroid isomerase-like protein